MMTGNSVDKNAPARWLGLLVICAAVAGAGYWLINFDPAIDGHPGNPLSEPTTSADIRAAQAASGASRAQREALAEEVVRGNMSFEQAGCEYRGGEWQSDGQVCDLPIGNGGTR